MSDTILELTRILQAVSLIDAPQLQVRFIVDSVSTAIDSDVCSLYRMNSEQDMELLASHGLQVSHPIIIPKGKGLVGVVAKARHVLNIPNADTHNDYFYVPSSKEEEFKSFCGVPLVRNGEVIGVLVVQSRQARVLSEQYEAFLSTLAAQLAFIVASLPSMDEQNSQQNIRYRGVKSVEGIGMGQALLCGLGALAEVVDVRSDDTAQSLQQWQDLMLVVQDELKAEQAMLGDQVSASIRSIFDAYQMLLTDASLNEKIIEHIQQGLAVPSAIKQGIYFFANSFKQMDDAYLHARAEDILHLGEKLIHAWNGGDRQIAVNHSDPVVLIGTHVSVSDIASIPTELLAGIICFEGSSLSHTSILANAMGIPAVMGVGKIKNLSMHDFIIVDGNEAQIILQPSSLLRKEYRKLIRQAQKVAVQLQSLKELPATTLDGHTLDLFTNTGLLADITPGLKSGAQGVGLYRTEIPFMVRDSFPSEEEQVQVYSRVFDAYAGKPVYMRTLDIGGDKQLPYFPIHHEENPALGWRGIRFTLDNIQLLMTQVRAMMRAANGSDALHILLPMVTSTHELKQFIILLDDAFEQLREEQFNVSRPKVGVMVEVPAAISQIPSWANKLDFISVGSNDLSQYLLALDRNNPHVANRYDHVHPAVIHEIQRTVQLAKQFNLPLSVCGEMASDPIAVVLLMGMGVQRLSMSAAKLPRIKWLIRNVECNWAQDILQHCLSLDDVKDIRSFVQGALKEKGLQESDKTEDSK